MPSAFEQWLSNTDFYSSPWEIDRAITRGEIGEDQVDTFPSRDEYFSQLSLPEIEELLANNEKYHFLESEESEKFKKRAEELASLWSEKNSAYAAQQQAANQLKTEI